MNKIISINDLLKSKLNGNYEAVLHYTGKLKLECNDFFFKSYDKGLSWHLYNGCDLVIGDVTLDCCIDSMLHICS